MMPCRICTTNDLDALAEEIGRATWELRRDPIMDPPWESASPHWHETMTGHAKMMIALVRPE